MSKLGKLLFHTVFITLILGNFYASFTAESTGQTLFSGVIALALLKSYLDQLKESI